jgi:quinol monooxygenase YgiN
MTAASNTRVALHGARARSTRSPFLVCAAVVVILAAHAPSAAQERTMMVRIAEIEVEADSVEAYRTILQEEAEASVRLEPGVIAIFPAYAAQRPTEFRILEIYASREAYDAHLKTPHFERYKTTTSKMVKSLRLVDMTAIDAATMTKMFVKMMKPTP